jgi:putative sterol carrier protein
MASQQEVAEIFSSMVTRVDPNKVGDLHAVIQFDLSGDNGGQYWVKINGGQAETGQGPADNPNMTLRAAADDWVAVYKGEMNAMTAFMNGKLKIQGDMGLAMKLQAILN